MDFGPHDTHYEALGVPEDAPIEIIKRSYQRSVLSLHPDKAASISAARNGSDHASEACEMTNNQTDGDVEGMLGSPRERARTNIDEAQKQCGFRVAHDRGARTPQESFSRVREAWKVLRDSDARAEYDEQLATGESKLGGSARRASRVCGQ